MILLSVLIRMNKRDNKMNKQILRTNLKFMRKLFFLLASTFLLAGCAESVVAIGGGTANGKLAQSSLQSAASYGVKKTTGKSPIGHAYNYVKKKNLKKENESCSSFDNKKDLEICLMIKERILSSRNELKEKKFTDKPSSVPVSSLRSSINKKSKIKYLD